jgi:hypothetical protein
MRHAFLAVLGADVALIAAAVIGYPAFWNQHGSAAYLAEPVVLLAVYAVVVLAATRSASVDRRPVLRAAALVGLASGALEAANISVETFTGLSGAANLATTAPLILGPFLVWSVVAGWAARVARSLRLGLLAADVVRHGHHGDRCDVRVRAGAGDAGPTRARSGQRPGLPAQRLDGR